MTSELFPTGHWVRVAGGRRRVKHWALCFIYELRCDRVLRPPPGWSALTFFSRKELKSIPVGREHADIIEAWAAARFGT